MPKLEMSSVERRAIGLLIVFLLAVLTYLSGSAGRVLVAGLVVLLVPGYLAWAALGRDVRLPPLVVPALWLGLSLSLIPIQFLWSSLLGLRLLPIVLQLEAIGLSLLAAWIAFRSRPARSIPLWLGLSFGAVLGLIALTRLLQIRGVALPLWVDSVHHTLLVRVVGETGRIPRSLEPYLPVPDLVYHWGYHVTSASWWGLARVPLAPMMLWSGQMLNAAVAIAVYGLGAYLARSPRVGLLAAGTAGLLSLLPAYYVTWGRYTQLTGLLLLPALVIASMALAERDRMSWRLVAATSILAAGLFLVHYRVLVFYLAWMLPYGVMLVARRPRRIGALAGRFAIVGVLAGMLAAPWLVVMMRRIFLPVAAEPSRMVGSDTYNSIEWTLLGFGNSPLLYAVALMGILIAFPQRRWRMIVVAGWLGVMVLLANPSLIGLPTSWFINNHSVIITIFMPVALLVGYAAHHITRWLEHRAPVELQWAPLGILLVVIGSLLAQQWGGVSIGQALAGPQGWLEANVAQWPIRSTLQRLLTWSVFGLLGIVAGYGAYLLWCALLRVRRFAWLRRSQQPFAITAALIGIALLGTWQLRSVINPLTVLAEDADVRAIEWAAQHTPPDARFLVNTTHWLNGAHRGTDGGWWLLPLAGRDVTTPPALYIYGGAAYKGQVEALNQRIAQVQPTEPDQLRQVIRDEHIDYVYVGAKPGGPLRSDLLFGDPAFTPVYDEDGVTIFQVNPIP
jgi:hypothetical protein